MVVGEVFMKVNFTYYKPGFLVTIIGLLWLSSSWLLSKVWGYGVFQGVGPAFVISILLVLYDKCLWKVKGFRYLNTVPNLNGRYSGKIEFHFNDKDDSKECVLRVRQSCSTLSISSTFAGEQENETKSTSTEAFIKTDESGEQTLYFYYHNRGSRKDGDTLNQHDGMTVLEINANSDGIELDGYYFTNRSPQTKGCMKLKKITKE